ncbi:hypothetical protein AAF712_012171 [Marasmius tenuissimus]|uniref:Uncharacterized protein n=1 Tax=Marasmius tenuissimus TaxID=585030 RepID=A0ABR2ZHC0_9AGAR
MMAKCYVIYNFRKIIILIPAIACLLSNGKPLPVLPKRYYLLLTVLQVLGIISMAIYLSAGVKLSSPLAKLIDKAIYLENAYYTLNALINVVLTIMVGECPI